MPAADNEKPKGKKEPPKVRPSPRGSESGCLYRAEVVQVTSLCFHLFLQREKPAKKPDKEEEEEDGEEESDGGDTMMVH